MAAPAGLAYRPFQKAGIAFAAAKPATLIADEMGLGKTIQALGALNAAGRERSLPALIVCPASLKLNWEREASKWLTFDASIGVAAGADLPLTDVVIINYDILPKHAAALRSRDWGAVIVDEAHYAKTLSFRGDKWTGSQRAKALQSIVERVERRIFLTGTPIANRPKDLYPLLAMLRPDKWRPERFFGFAKRYCGAHHNGYGWSFDGISNAAELQDTLRSEVMIRRRKADVLTELPAKQRTLVTLSATARELAHERKLKEKWAAYEMSDNYAEVADHADDSASLLFAEIAAARHRTALAKAPRVVEFVKEALEAEDKVIVFAHHRDVVDALKAGLDEYAPVTIVGDDGMKARQDAVDRFQNGSVNRVAICNIQAGGVGLTLTAARTVIFAELDWTPTAITQAGGSGASDRPAR